MLCVVNESSNPVPLTSGPEPSSNPPMDVGQVTIQVWGGGGGIHTGGN